MAEAEDKLRALVDMGIALTSELALDAVLERLVEAAAALTGARYAALGVIDRDGKELERFVAHGLTPEERRAIGELPRGRGLLGALIRDARPLRLADLVEDARSVGFPPNHPTMHSFLGVPVLLRGVAYGNLYLTEKAGGDEFTVGDEELVSLLASQAAVAIENARLYESELRWSSQLEALEEIAVALAGEADLPRQLELVAAALRGLLSSRIVAVALSRQDGTLLIHAGSGEEVAGVVLPADTKTARVLARQQSELVDSLRDDAEVDQRLVERYRANTALIVPLLIGGRALGVLIAIDKEGPDQRFDDEDLRLAESYARRAAVAVDLSQRVARDALQRAVTAQELERRRIARELHDGTGQALTSILLGLSSIDPEGDPNELRAALRSLRELAVSTLQDVRRLSIELRPKALDDFGLLPALRRLGQSVAERSPLDVQVEAHLGEGRLSPEAETAVYRIVQEALTNVVRHADASRVSVVLTRKNAGVSVVIEDDGKGFEPEHASERGGLGLLGMRERVQLLDGTLEVDSSPGAGTALVFHLPVE